MFQILISSFKCVFIFALAYVLYLTYTLVVYPYICWRKYKKYSNVYTTPKFIPLLGDLKGITDDLKQGKVHYYEKIRKAPETKDKDLRLKFEGYHPILLLLSNKAIEEFAKLVPTKIDRVNTGRGLGRLGLGTFLLERSTKRTIMRRKLLTSFLSLNSSSRHIPAMVKYTAEVLKPLKEGEKQDFIEICNVLTFNIFTSVLFGEDMVGLANKVRPYKNTDGTTSMLPLRDIMINVFKAYFIQIFHPLSATMKQVADLNIVNPFKRDHENYLTFMEGIKELYRNCKDETSICKQILKNQKLTESEKIFDLNTFIFAGAETSSHGIVSTLFFMKKYPESFEKLRKEIQDAGISKETLFSEGLTREKIEELDYLTCVVKEGLRIDGPGAESFVYAASQDVELCGVPIPKGFPIKVDLATGHYNEDYWKDPHDFVPERYDDESEFYKQAEKEGKFGLGFSTRPFSHGFRACPGQSFALLEMKVAIIVILTLIDYEVDPELFQKEGVGFGVGGSIPASFKINWR
ncbi:unnamed protein product [Moneuplotes crassus]|uniref:Cytochrome P450 n=1 Tax=Euplotes crassus TaxID=5936 RepID=A0AAD1U9B4_EUPCR|nr:unnamed protein product [Moneuplotes crassus]